MRGILRPIAIGAWVAALLAAAIVPSMALAKEGVEARLDRPVPTDAAAGSTISVGWSLWVRDSASHWTTRKVNQTICYDVLTGPCYHSLVEFYRPSGVPVQQGDSGGPLWYRYRTEPPAFEV